MHRARPTRLLRVRVRAAPHSGGRCVVTAPPPAAARIGHGCWHAAGASTAPPPPGSCSEKPTAWPSSLHRSARSRAAGSSRALSSAPAGRPPWAEEDAKEAMKSEEREAVRITWVGLVGNVGLSGLKFGVGTWSGSASLVADAAHSCAPPRAGWRAQPAASARVRRPGQPRIAAAGSSRQFRARRRFSDTASDCLALVAVKLARKPPDSTHPYGYGHYETLGTLGISALLLGTGAAIGLHSLQLVLPRARAGRQPFFYVPFLLFACAWPCRARPGQRAEPRARPPALAWQCHHSHRAAALTRHAPPLAVRAGADGRRARRGRGVRRCGRRGAAGGDQRGGLLDADEGVAVPRHAGRGHAHPLARADRQRMAPSL